MQKAKSILLLMVVGIMIIPWHSICIAHPFGHGHVHHEPGKLSPCELHAKYAHEEGQHFLPPMHCDHLSPDTDEHQVPGKFRIKPTCQILAIAVILFEFIKISYPEQSYLFPPEPKCRSATIISAHTLRGPPLV